MQANPDFLAEVRKSFPPAGAKLVVGCKSGRRSAAACALLAEHGYDGLVDQTGGWDGWVAAGLPVEK